MNSKKEKISEVSELGASSPGSRAVAIKVGIIGGAGYTGGELIRLLIHIGFF